MFSNDFNGYDLKLFREWRKSVSVPINFKDLPILHDYIIFIYVDRHELLHIIVIYNLLMLGGGREHQSQSRTTHYIWVLRDEGTFLPGVRESVGGGVCSLWY